MEVPEWHKNLVRKRITEYKRNPEKGLDFDSAIDDIEHDLVRMTNFYPTSQILPNPLWHPFSPVLRSGPPPFRQGRIHKSAC